MDLPILSSHLSDVPRKRWPSERQSFLTTLEVVEQAHKAGMIANPVYQDAKQAVNRAFERARYQLAERHVNAGKYRACHRTSTPSGASLARLSFIPSAAISRGPRSQPSAWITPW